MRASGGYRYPDAAAKSRRPRTITVRARPGHAAQGILRAGALTLPCALGRGGISATKREGDGATPLACMRVLRGFFRAGAARDLEPRRTLVPMQAAGADLGWCDASGDRNYNRPVRLPYPAGHETMRRADRLYDVVMVLDWNVAPRKRNRGSAIFLHLARPGLAATEGCIALSRRSMARLLPLLTPDTRIKVLR